MDTFTTGEYDLNCNFDPSPVPISLGTTMYAFWDLLSDRTDALQNFSNIILEGNMDITFPLKAFYFDGEHSLVTPTGTAGMDLESLQFLSRTYNSTSTAYGFGFQFMLESLPTTGAYRWLGFAGTLENHIGFRVHSDGRCEYVRKKGSTIESVYTPAVKINEWHAAYFVHDNSGALPCGMFYDGGFSSLSAMLVPGSTSETDRHPFYLGKGPAYSTKESPASWDTGKCGGSYTFSSDFLTVSATRAASYQSCAATSQLTAQDKKYWEVTFVSGNYAWLGVAPPTKDFTLSPALIGTCFALHNGRRWNMQTGGGTDWTDSVPVGSTVGLAWDGPAGTLSVYVDGGLRGTMPYTIDAPVVPFMGSTAACSMLLRPRQEAWLYGPPDNTYSGLAGTATLDGGNAPLFRGRMRYFRLRKGYPDATEINAIMKTDINPMVTVKSLATGVEYPIDNCVYKWYEDRKYLGIKTPDVPNGVYKISAKFNGQTYYLRTVNITHFSDQICNEAFHDDFKDTAFTMKNWDAANKAWGGDNGGVSAKLLKIKGDGMVRCIGTGDNYTGFGYGVDMLGNDTKRKTRVGSCLVSKKYFPPGIFKFKCKYPQLTGACSAIWTFHYEESYPRDDLWSELISDGLHKQGSEALGHWIVRNHEIDIEIPSCLKSFPDLQAATYSNAKFNTWRGEVRNWDVKNNDVPQADPMYAPENDPAYWSEYTDNWLPLPGGAINDEKIHELIIDWNTDPAEVNFYVDGTLVCTNTTHIPTIPMKVWVGIWFPSAKIKWAGASAPWETQEFILYDFDYTPH